MRRLILLILVGIKLSELVGQLVKFHFASEWAEDGFVAFDPSDNIDLVFLGIGQKSVRSTR